MRTYANDPISFTLEGPAELIGDNPFALIGGTGAVWVRAKEQAGTASDREASAAGLADGGDFLTARRRRRSSRKHGEANERQKPKETPPPGNLRAKNIDSMRHPVASARNRRSISAIAPGMELRWYCISGSRPRR